MLYNSSRYKFRSAILSSRRRQRLLLPRWNLRHSETGEISSRWDQVHLRDESESHWPRPPSPPFLLRHRYSTRGHPEWLPAIVSQLGVLCTDPRITPDRLGGDQRVRSRQRWHWKRACAIYYHIWQWRRTIPDKPHDRYRLLNLDFFFNARKRNLVDEINNKACQHFYT